MLDLPLHCSDPIPRALMAQVVRVESGSNPYAIGVVGGRLVRQPRNRDEAMATAEALESQGYNYSIGTGQVNRQHFQRLGWKANLQSGFDPCENLKASASILGDCFAMAKRAGVPHTASGEVTPATRAALSCYYSGSLRRGEELGYVSKVVGAPSVGALAIPVVRTGGPVPPKSVARKSMFVD